MQAVALNQMEVKMEAFKMTDNVMGFRFGNPVETGVIQGEKTQVEMNLPIELREEGGKATFTLRLTENERVYGLGPNLGGINKRGRIYESYCTDDPLHHEDKTTLYGAHNFFVLEDDDVATGFFIDFPGRVKYDVGFTTLEELQVEIHGKDFDIYLLEGSSIKEIVASFHKLAGKPYMPPKWGLGYFQSRWGYQTEEDVKKVYETFKEEEIPLDGIYLDLDYMEDFKDFTLSEERFPNFKKMAHEMKEEGVRLIPIIDAGVKIEEGYHVYEEGIKGDHFVKDAEGKPYVAAVWPGKVHFPDFLKEETQKWFGDQYKILTDAGIEGVWNDMNEPAIFYDETSLQEGVEAAILAQGGNLNVNAFFSLRDKFMNIGNKLEYYRRFFHEIGDRRLTNEEVHNLYGYMMTKSASLGLRKHLGKRHVLISRASSIGMHRYGGLWTGDNSSWWSHLSLNLRMLPSLNMSGFYYVGADTGGFGGHVSGELLTRWLQLSVFTPLLRNHSAIGTRVQEPYAFGDALTRANKKHIERRYMLIPYLYSEMLKTYETGGMMFTPLAFEFFGEEAQQAEDQMLLGEELMLAPVVSQNAKGRYVYLPEDMVLVDFKKYDSSLTLLKDGVHYVSYTLDDLKFFLRRNRMMPYTNPSQTVKDQDLSVLKVLGYVDTEAVYVLYDDDGESFGYEQGKIYKTTLYARKLETGGMKVEAKSNHPDLQTVNFTLMDGAGEIWNEEVKVQRG